ncbi:hypothetical protein [Microcoleus sp. Pol12A6]|uniref:hypothetical protein n=1 Tax=Microcoleus sp. Pol12A6 TaxID=3055393 RepID=UPI002FCE69E9
MFAEIAITLYLSKSQSDIYGKSDRLSPIEIEELVASYSEHYKQTETRLLQTTGFINIVAAFSTD